MNIIIIHKGSNNTAELTAIGEGLLWILQYIRNQSNPNHSKHRHRVIIRYDSEYAANSVLGIFNGKKNVELIQKIRTIYQQVNSAVKSISFKHVKGHSGHVYNDRADRLANQGAVMFTGVGGRYSSPPVVNSKSASKDSPLTSASTEPSIPDTMDEQVPTSDLPSVLFLYTDGCCIGNTTHHACPSGWGVTITKPSVSASASINGGRIDIRGIESDPSKCEKVDELYGPVVLDATSPFYLCATVGK